MNRHCLLFSAILMLAGCAPRLEARDDDAGGRDASVPRSDGGFPATSGRFVHALGEDGVITTVVDASDGDAWPALDLDTGLADTGGWDLAFSRFRVRTNGGIHGEGGVQAVALPGQAFETLTRAPEAGWTTDRPGADGMHENAFHGGPDGASDWYAYDLATHTLTPRDATFVIASSEARFYKLRFLGYYDEAGSPAHIRFVWAELAPPASALPDAGPPTFDGGVDAGVEDGGVEPVRTTLTVDASDRAAWVYVRLGAGVVSVADPSAGGWDLAFRRSAIRTSSGTSGPGLGGARLAPAGVPYETLTEAGTLGYVEDAIAPSAMPGAEPTSGNAVLAGWFDYDPATHSVRAGERAYFVRTADGAYAKLRIWSWTSGVYELSFEPVVRRPERVELEVRPPAEGWAYVSLRDGTMLDATSDRWDLALAADGRLATNGGASGPGLGAAVETRATSIDELGAVPTTGWVTDASAELGNAVLARWRDASTSSPRAVVFAVRTAEGHAAALQILSHDDGRYRVALRYAGPSQSTF